MTVVAPLHCRPTTAGHSGYATQPGAETAIKQEPSTAQGLSRVGFMTAVQRFSAAVLEARDVAAIEKALVEAVEQTFPTAIIALARTGTNEENFVRAGGINLTVESKRTTACAERVLPAVAAAVGIPVAIADADRNSVESLDEWFRQHGLTSCLRVPLIAGAEPLGQLSLCFKARTALGDDETEFLATIASQAAQAIRYARLAMKTREQSAELRKLRDELARSHLAKTEFLSVVSHEFRTPLNIIMGYAALMEEELVGTIGAEQRNCLEQIRNASHDLLDLVMRMLQAGSLEAGLLRVKNEEIALCRLLDEVKREIRPREQNVQLIWGVAADLPPIMTDPEKLKQILHNLIDNALKFTERGQVRIVTKMVSDQRQLHIDISDTGIGIAAEVLPFVFERYRQADGSISRAYEGLGLGLFIAKKLTDLLGGALTVTSEIGTGSTFTVALPCSQ
jgi:signal transduction histidine kinase